MEPTTRIDPASERDKGARPMGFEVPMGTDPVSIRRRIEAMEQLLENSFAIPGVNYRIGLDSIIGLVPVIGDFVAAAMGMYIVWEARNLGLPKWKLWRMSGNVLFDFDKSDLTPAAKAQLDTLMDKLRNADVVSIKVIGHTDSKGSDAYNQALSERRASSVAAYLLSQGLAPNKLTSEGRGESEPVADNATDEGRAKNRRVELHINR